MARAKKNDTALTLEEKLEQALVPDWEWPYKLPENWCWTKMGSVCLFERGITFPASAKSKESNGMSIPCLRTANVQEELEINDLIFVNQEYMKGNEAKLVRLNDIIMSSANSRELVGKVSFVRSLPFPMTFGGFVLNIRAKGIDSKYLFHFLRHEFLNGKFMGQSTQTTNIANISTSTLDAYEVPLAPLNEQHRIVSRIESLFAKLDEAKEKAQATLDSFETRKAAILHKAFTGELTAKWREEHDTDLSEWRKCLLSDVVNEFKYGTSEKSDYNNAGMPVIRIPNIGDDGLDFTDLKYLPHNNVETESQIHENDILIIRSNGSRDLVGKSVRVPYLDQPYTYASFLIRIKPTPIVRSDYLVAYLNSADARSQMFKKAKSSAGINNINSKELGAITLSLPSTEEQFEIVQILENHISKEQRAKAISEAVLEQIDLIKKAILSRAFRGELGTNDPTEESALELLKQILSGKATDSKSTKKPVSTTSIPVEIAAMLYSKLEKDIVKVFYQHSDTIASIDEILAVGKNKMGIISTLTNLEQRGIIVRHDQTNYCIKE